MDLCVVPYDNHLHKSQIKHNDNNSDDFSDKFSEPVVMNPKTSTPILTKYKECMRNHAASMGGHASDGCGEFMATHNDSLTCAACGCHRNFHKKEVPDLHPFVPSQPPLLMARLTTPRWEQKMVNVENEIENEDRRSETPERGEMQLGRCKGKRFRTKFTPEQKERMLNFAESIGWRIQKHDNMALNQFCSEIGVKRNVLKVWMHNNKNVYRRRDEMPAPPSHESSLPDTHSVAAAPRQPAGV